MSRLVPVFCKSDTVELIIARDEKARDRPAVSLADMFESLSLGAEEDGRKHAKAVDMNTLDDSEPLNNLTSALSSLELAGPGTRA